MLAVSCMLREEWPADLLWLIVYPVVRVGLDTTAGPTDLLPARPAQAISYFNHYPTWPSAQELNLGRPLMLVRAMVSQVTYYGRPLQ